MFQRNFNTLSSCWAHRKKKRSQIMIWECRMGWLITRSNRERMSSEDIIFNVRPRAATICQNSANDKFADSCGGPPTHPNSVRERSFTISPRIRRYLGNSLRQNFIHGEADHPPTEILPWQNFGKMLLLSTVSVKMSQAVPRNFGLANTPTVLNPVRNADANVTS